MTTQPNYTVEAQYITRIHQALDAVLARVIAAGDTRVLDLATDRYIIFSDQHRGARNGADDFQRAERAYNAALAYYLHMGHTLIVLGDVEELWEETPATVIRAYRHSLELEARFHRRGRYVRIWGNHDDEWQYADSVRRYLEPVYGDPPLRVHEGLHFTVREGAEELGSLLLLHGHQGDAFNDQWAWITRILVRYVWRTFQRLTRISLNTPATSWDLRKKINEAIYTWAAQQQKLLLVAGHTHNPVFKSQSHEMQINEAIADLTKCTPESEMPRTELGRLLAQREWVRAQDPDVPPQEIFAPMAKPCYFNTGCCCYADGDITGIEIADGQIRLVRWPDKARRPQPHILAEADLRAVLSAC
ncbi:MAG: metallophosphoesterase [Anaerolineae bacterium]